MNTLPSPSPGEGIAPSREGEGKVNGPHLLQGMELFYLERGQNVPLLLQPFLSIMIYAIQFYTPYRKKNIKSIQLFTENGK